MERAAHEDAFGLVGEPGGRERRVAQGPGCPGDLVENVVQPQRGGHRAIHVTEPLEPLDLMARRVVEPRVLDRHRGQCGQGRQRLYFRGGGLVRFPPVGRQAAKGRALRENRHGQGGPVPLVLDQPPDRIAPHHPAAENLGGPDRSALRHGPPRCPLAGRYDHFPHELLREARPARIAEQAVGVEPEDPARPDPHELEHPLDDPIEDPVRIQGGADQAADLEQGPGLGLPVPRFLVEPRVRHRDRHHPREVGRQAHVLVREGRPARSRTRRESRRSRPAAGRGPRASRGCRPARSRE